MKALALAGTTSFALAFALTQGATGQAPTPPPAATAHVAAAKAAARTDFTGVFDRICPTAIAPPSAPRVATLATPGSRPASTGS